MTTKNYEFMSVVTGATIVCTALIAGISIFNINDRNNMAKNIEAGISKGLDPLSVKCAYETHPSSATCITFAAVRK